MGHDYICSRDCSVPQRQSRMQWMWCAPAVAGAQPCTMHSVTRHELNKQPCLNLQVCCWVLKHQPDQIRFPGSQPVSLARSNMDLIRMHRWGQSRGRGQVSAGQRRRACQGPRAEGLNAAACKHPSR